MASPRKTFAVLAVLAVGLSMLAGCTPANPDGQPTYSCTPDDGSSPYACAKVQYDAKAKEAALYTEAEQVYRKFFAEEERIYRAGGITEPSPVLLETTTGDYLAESMTIYQNIARRKLRVVSGSTTIAWIHRAPDRQRPGLAAAMQSCRDSRQQLVASPNGQPTPGRLVIETAQFERVGDVLKIIRSTSRGAETC